MYACSGAQQRRCGSDSNLLTLIRAEQCFWPSTVLMHVEQVRKIETGLEKSQRLPRKQRFIVLVQCTGEEGPARKHKLWFIRQNLFGRPQCLCMSSRSEKSKQDSRRASGCRENWDLFCLCNVQERWNPLENANCDSRSRMLWSSTVLMHVELVWKIWILLVITNLDTFSEYRLDTFSE
jgi:hypothetical protein